MAKLPKHLYSLFWDTNPKDLDPDKYPKYVIERVMELGDIPHLRWMLKYYHRQKLKKFFWKPEIYLKEVPLSGPIF